MSTISYDSQSLMVDGRRLWLTSCAFDYTRVPRLHWRGFLYQLKTQGFNCIAITVPWNHHEPKQGQFDFTGERDLRHLLEIMRDLGLYCTLKPGPYAGAHHEGGGLPAWLSAMPEIKLRESNRPFLDSCARWFAAYMEQVRDFQVTLERSAERPQPGPVLLMQVEHDWRCQNDAQATGYLTELARYLREGGCQVPLLEGNNGWQTIDSTFSIWRGHDDLSATMRQFRAVQQLAPAQQFPLFVSEVTLHGDSKHEADDAVTIAQALASQTQVEIDLSYSDKTATTPNLSGLPRQLLTFSQQFAQLFAHLSNDHHHIALAPAAGSTNHCLSLLHQQGTQGDVVFIFKSERNKAKSAQLLLNDGSMLHVDMGDQSVAWVVMNVKLAGTATLNYTNLCPLAFIDQRMLVLVGPAGSEGVVSIDDSVVDVVVERGDAPMIVDADGITLVILNSQQAAASVVTDDRLYVGVSTVDEHGQAQPHRSFKQPVVVTSDGQCNNLKIKPAKRTPTAPKLGPWSVASGDAYADGSSAAFSDVAPGSSLSALAPMDRAGFYHLALPSSQLGAKLVGPYWADRLTIYQHGKIAAQLPAKPNESLNQPFTLKNSAALTLLASHEGHARDGWRMGERKGLTDHLYQVKPIKLPVPKRSAMRLPDVTPWRGFLPDVSYHIRPTVSAWTWTIKPTGKQGLILTIDDLPFRAIVLVNGVPVAGYDPIESTGCVSILLELGKEITGGRNRIDVVPMEEDEKIRRVDPRKFVRCYDAMKNLTAKATWRFASIAPPGEAAFLKGERSRKRLGVPAWFRSEFATPRAALPLYVEVAGLTGAQAWLNGHALGAVSDEPLHLPHDWLIQDAKQMNVLTIFDEQGVQPRTARLRFGV